MDIIFTVESYFPLKNGVQEITQRYAEFLAGNGHRVRVITQSVSGTSSDEMHNGVEIHRVDVRTKKSVYLGQIKQYIDYIVSAANEADVLINVCAQTAFTDCLLKHLSKIKAKKVLYLHGMAHFNFPIIPTVDLHDIMSWLLNVVRWRLFYFSNCKYFEMYDSVIHLHEKDKSYQMMEKKDVKNYVLENGCSDLQFSQDMQKKKAENAAFIMIANYIHDKNQELILKAYYKAETKHPLVFVGSKETDYLDKLREIVSELEGIYGKKDVSFIVGESHQETMERLKNAYCLIHSSKSEKYPVVICEAQKTKTPFICTDTGICKYLPGGIVVRTEIEIIDAINALKNGQKWSKLSELGYAYSLQNQDFEKNCMKLLEIIS